jgi:hypothetical protein
VADRYSSSLNWQTSRASAGSNCVEVARVGAEVLVRDSKDKSGPVLTFSAAEWSAFVVGARSGEFDA